MIELALSTVFRSRRRREKLAASARSQRRCRISLSPDAESLEVRDCPSVAAPHSGVDRPAHDTVAVKHHTPLIRHIDAKALVKKSKSKTPQTIYVAPKGKTGASAGKSSRHPLGSLTVAMRRATSGSTIILLPGVYTQGAMVNGKSNLTIMGAANNGTILAASGNALRLVNCSNVTIDNVWFRSQGVGLSVQGSSVTLNNIKTNGSTAYGVLATPSGGQNSSVNATSSHFDGTQTGDGLHLGPGTSVTITNCTFDGNGGPSSQTGNGLVMEGGTTATITNSHFDNDVGNGLFTWGNAQVTVSQSTFDGTTMGDGMHLTQNSSATISNCTFNNNGTAANAPESSNGFDIDGSSTATVTGSQFNDNHNGGIVASDSSQIKLQSSTVVGNVHSDGAIFFNQANVTLTGNTFASNGQVVGITTGLNGVEFFGGAGQANNYTGTAVVSGNSFQNNTANGIYAGSGGNLTISNNQFSGNVVGVFLDGTGASINATVVGNTIVTPANSPGTYNGITLQGTGVTATIGGAGTDGNTLNNFFDSAFIVEAFGMGPDTGLPHASILANAYIQNGNPISASVANYVE